MASVSGSSSEILGQYEKSVSAATGGSNRVASDKDTFLKLLIAQLTHQDPMNPAEDKEFIAQLAQFTSLEELQKINGGIEKLQGSQAQQQVVSAASLVGMQVTAKGDVITKYGDYASTLFATIKEPIASGTVKVYSTYPDGSIGRLVHSENLGPRQAGEFKYEWDGTDGKGGKMEDGTYIITISGIKADGSPQLVDTKSLGNVVGVKTSPDGNHQLYLNDGRTVRFNDIELISYPIEKPAEKPE